MRRACRKSSSIDQIRYPVDPRSQWTLSDRPTRVHIRYLTRSLRSLVRYRCDHSKINSISPSVRVLFCLLYKHTNNDVFDDFPKISDHFPKISEDFPKLFRRLGERLRTFSEHFPKIAEDCRR